MFNIAPGMNRTGAKKELKKKKRKTSMETQGYPESLGSVDFIRLKSLREKPQCSRAQNLYWIQLNGEAEQTQTTEKGVGLLYMNKQGVYYIHINKKMGLVNLSRNSLSKGVICRL